MSSKVTLGTIVHMAKQDGYLAAKKERKTNRKPPSILDTGDPTDTFLQQANQTLYTDPPHITADGTLYRWEGTHYEPCPDPVELRRIQEFCNNYSVEDDNGKTKYPFAKPVYVRQVLEWAKMATGIDARQINPAAALNCKNGVLHIEWSGNTLKPRLVPHDPSYYYTYRPLVTYDPQADLTGCNRLLECLEPTQRRVFLQTIACSLDLPTVRKFKGRLPKALFLKGDGQNGKDTLRTVVSMLYGSQGLTGCSLGDFKEYDTGRKFPLADLESSRVNWPSETVESHRVDRLQSLKSAITGDTLSFERKNKEARLGPVRSVFLFNVNHAPNLTASLEALKSRWAILTFNKTYKAGADTARGEIEADPRFKEDPTFIERHILPAFLNLLLEQLQAVVTSGINYAPLEGALDEVRRTASHLLQFAYDEALEEHPETLVSVAEVWNRLKQWYQNAGILSVETTSAGKEKLFWEDSGSKGDRLIKARNQIVERFTELYPKAKVRTVRDPVNRNPQLWLTGIVFATEQQVEELGTQGTQYPLNAYPEQDTANDDWERIDHAQGTQSPELGTHNAHDEEICVPNDPSCVPNAYPPCTQLPTPETYSQREKQPPCVPCVPKKATYQPGTKMQYVGNDRILLKHYDGVVLTFKEMRNGKANAFTPKGDITTWIPLADLRPLTPLEET